MKIRLQEKLPNVYVVSFETKYELCMTFVRIQEFYESPDFRGKYFSLEEFMDYWAETQGFGSFDYPARWGGFNVPGVVLNEWMRQFGYDKRTSNHSNTLRKKEIILLDRVMKKIRKTGNDIEDIYLIGTSRDNPSRKQTEDHEVAHAMYTLYPEYKKIVDVLLRNASGKKVAAAKNRILGMGYGENVVKDEIQAYWSTNDDTEDEYPDDPLVRNDKFRDAYLSFLKNKR